MNTASDINQNNIGEKISKSKSPEGKNMESEGNVFNEHNGDVFSSEQQNGEMLNFEGALVKENSNAESSLSPEQSETTENTPDVVDGAVLAKLDTESATELNTIEQEESKQAELEPAIDITNPCDNEQSSDHPEFSVENSEEPSSEQAPPAEAMTEDLDVVPNESEIAKNYNDVPPKDAEVSASIHEVPPSDSDVPPGDAEIPASDAQVLPSDGEVPPKDPDVSPAVIPEDSKTSESPSPTPESTSSASTTPDIPQSPQKCPSPSGKKDGVEPLKKKTGKTTKDSTKTKPAGTKAAAKKEPGSTVGSRPKSAKPLTRPTADSSAVKNTKRPTSAVKSSTTAKSGTTTKSSTTGATKTKTTGDGKPSAAASKTKAPPSGKPTTTPSGKTSPTHSKKPTNKPDPKATPSTRTARPARTTAFGSTVSTTAAKKTAPKTRPATAPPARSTTTQAKKKPVAAKVQTWSSSATRPQSAKPSTKSNDSTDGVAASKEIGGDRPTSPTKPLVRKTQTRTVTTTKTTRVGAGGDPETKSQTLKTTRTVTEANGKKTTKTTVKEISPTGRKPLRMTTETTEGGTGAKKPTKAVTDSKTGTRTAKPGTKKPETKSGAKTGPSRPTKETGAKKATTKTASKGKEVKGEIKGVPKAKTVKELSNALGITKPSDGKEKDDKDIETEPNESVEKKVEEPRPTETPELAPELAPELVVKAETVKELSVVSSITILKASDGKEDTKIETGPKEEKEVEEPKPAETPELAPAQIEESPQVDESVQVEESVKVEESVQECDLSEVSPEAEEVAPECEVTVTDQDGESGVVNVEGGIEEVPQGHEDSDGSEDIVENTEEQSVQQENNEVAESAEDLENASDQGEEIDHRVLMNGDTVEQSADIVSDVNLVDVAEDINIEDKMAEPAEQVEENKDEIGDEIAANDDEESGEPIIDFVHQVLTEAHEEELRDPSELIVQDSPEPRNSSGIIDDSLEDDSLDIIVVPESDVSYEEGALQSTEAWSAVSVGQEMDLLGDNNNAVEETEPKLNPYLIPSGADPEEPADSTADQDLFDINADGKAEPWFVGDTGNTGEPTNRDSGFQENNTVDDLLG